MKRKSIKIILIIFFFTILTLILIKYFKKDEVKQVESVIKEDVSNKSNVIEDVNYTSKDAKGNEYIINASRGEIDYSNTNIIFLTNVKAVIKLNNSNNINIQSDFGKYNTNNFDTIFSKNVIIDYLDNKIKSEYLDFSLEKNIMIISRNVVYTNTENVLTADVMEMNIKTKDTKIFMFEEEKKVNIKTKN